MVCRKRGLKVNAGKNKAMMLGGEEGLECEVCVDEILLDYVSESKYLGCVLYKSCTDEAECSRKEVAGSIRYLVNIRSLQLSVLGYCMSHCWCLFLHMVVRQLYGGGLGLELYKWTTSEVCWTKF